MVWSNHGEVASVQRGDGSYPQSLSSGNYRGVHRSQRQIAVAPNYFGNSQPVAGQDRFHAEHSTRKITEETHLGGGAEPSADEVHDLGDHELGDDEWLWVGLEQVKALSVASIVRVDVRVQRPGIDDEYYRPLSARRISSMRSEMSV